MLKKCDVFLIDVFILFLTVGCGYIKPFVENLFHGEDKTLPIEMFIKNTDEQNILELKKKDIFKNPQEISFRNFGLVIYCVNFDEKFEEELKRNLELKKSEVQLDGNKNILWHASKIPWYFVFYKGVKKEGLRDFFTKVIFKQIKGNQGDEEYEKKLDSKSKNGDITICKDKNFRLNKNVVMFKTINTKNNDLGFFYDTDVLKCRKKSFYPSFYFINDDNNNIQEEGFKNNNGFYLKLFNVITANDYNYDFIYKTLLQECLYHNGLYSITRLEELYDRIIGVSNRGVEIIHDIFFKGFEKSEKDKECKDKKDVKKKITVLVTGHSRIGKSTFLNALSSISETSKYGDFSFFKTGDDKISVTRNINVVPLEIKDKNIGSFTLFLCDSPGLEKGGNIGLKDGKKYYYEDYILDFCKDNMNKYKPDIILYLVKANREKAYKKDDNGNLLTFDLYSCDEDKDKIDIDGGQMSEITYIKELAKTGIPIAFCVLQSMNHDLGCDTLRHMLSSLTYDLDLYKKEVQDEYKDTIFGNNKDIIIVPMQIFKEKEISKTIQPFGLVTLFTRIAQKVNEKEKMFNENGSISEDDSFWAKKLNNVRDLIIAVFTKISDIAECFRDKKCKNKYFNLFMEENVMLEKICRLEEEFSNCFDFLRFVSFYYNKSVAAFGTIKRFLKDLSKKLKKDLFDYSYGDVYFDFSHFKGNPFELGCQDFVKYFILDVEKYPEQRVVSSFKDFYLSCGQKGYLTEEVIQAYEKTFDQ